MRASRVALMVGILICFLSFLLVTGGIAQELPRPSTSPTIENLTNGKIKCQLKSVYPQIIDGEMKPDFLSLKKLLELG